MFRKHFAVFIALLPVCLILIVVHLASAAPTCTTICYVNSATGDDSNDGASPATAYKSIQTAVNQVNSGGTVEVAAGTYTETVTIDKALTLNGANAGISPNDDEDPLDPNPERGAESLWTVTADNRAISISDPNVTVDGFKFTNTDVTNTTQIQSPIIGAGANFGGDAPGVAILNNLFEETTRTLVYFNGPSTMEGGTVEDNRVVNPDRADESICGSGATANSSCGHQLFNLWRTNNLSFQRNVTIADPSNGDRMRTLNIINSTNVTLAHNTIRNTCVFTCFSIPEGADNVLVAYNDIETDVGNTVQLFSSWVSGTITVTHNLLTTPNDFNVVIDNASAVLDDVIVNRNAFTGGGFRNASSDTINGVCNWWGQESGPLPAQNSTTPPNDGPFAVDPWLKSDDLDGLCADYVYLSTEDPGSVAGAGNFSVEDILAYDVISETWSLLFDGSAHGLTTKNDINGMQVNASDDLYLSFFANKTNVPDIPGKVTGHDIVHFDGGDFSLYFDGSAVGLTTVGEKLDGLTILDSAESPIGSGCLAYLLVSTIGTGRVPNHSGGSVKFQGEDVLGFCLLDTGADTEGLWHLALDGSAEGMPKNSTYGLTTNDGVDNLHFITKANFNVDDASGSHSELFRFDGDSFHGPLFSAPDEGLDEKVNAIDVAFAD